MKTLTVKQPWASLMFIEDNPKNRKKNLFIK